MTADRGGKYSIQISAHWEGLRDCCRRKLGPCPIPSIDQYGVHHISSQHEIQFFHLQPRLDQQLARWEIINEEWKMPETSMLPITRIIHVTTSFMGLKWPTHWGTWTPLCLMRPVRRCLYFCRPTVLLLPSLPALWPCPCSFTAGSEAPYNLAGLDWLLLVLAAARTKQL